MAFVVTCWLALPAGFDTQVDWTGPPDGSPAAWVEGAALVACVRAGVSEQVTDRLFPGATLHTRDSSGPPGSASRFDRVWYYEFGVSISRWGHLTRPPAGAERIHGGIM